MRATNVARRAAVLVTAAIASAGCAASRASVTADADHLLGPVSLSSSVPGTRGEILRRDRDLEVVGRFTRVRTYRAIAWGLLLPWRTWDATDVLNEEIRRYNGEAIVDLYVSTDSMSGGETALAALACFIPVIPTSITVRISGTVVRRKRAPHGPPATVPATPTRLQRPAPTPAPLPPPSQTPAPLPPPSQTPAPLPPPSQTPAPTPSPIPAPSSAPAPI